MHVAFGDDMFRWANQGLVNFVCPGLAQSTTTKVIFRTPIDSCLLDNTRNVILGSD
jgi:hypothetical protein